MTETNAAFIRNTAAEYAQYPASVGRPFPTHDVRLVDESGDDVKRGDLGEIWVRGPLVCKGYWGNPAKTKEAFTEDGWYKTGDVAREDENGLFYIMDRIKDMIIRG
jgi:long-subunit acyl-CoA synthetase (AMP-forming)